MGATDEPVIRNVSDTARWVAILRAVETERPDAHFKDPFARRLAGPRGEQLLARAGTRSTAWVVVSRTVIINELIQRALAEGADTVVNLAAGLDTRPYWMNLPLSLRWIEVDLPPILEEKEQALAGEKPVCQLERIKLDLADPGARRALLERIGRESRKAVVLTEGLLMYLTVDQVGALARDLAATPAFHGWITDLVSPAVLPLIRRQWGEAEHANAPLHFAPAEQAEAFAPYGWKAREVRSLLKEAARLRRGNLLLRLAARLEPWRHRAKNRAWSGICLLQRSPPEVGEAR